MKLSQAEAQIKSEKLVTEEVDAVQQMNRNQTNSNRNYQGDFRSQGSDKGRYAPYHDQRGSFQEQRGGAGR